MIFILSSEIAFAFSQAVPVKMNEIYSRDTSTNPDWIELYNRSSISIDLSKFKIYDSGGKSGSKAKNFS